MKSTALAAGVCAIALVGSAAAARAEVPSVVASVKPVHSLAAAVMRGVGEPTLLLEANLSPHTYALRPSDARTLAGADLVFWVGPGIESFLERALDTLAAEAEVVTLVDAPGMALLPYREGGFFEPHAHGDETAHEGHDHGGESDHAGHDHSHDAAGHDAGGHDHAHGYNGMDTHVWLDPANAAAMTRAIAESLAGADPENAEIYRSNAAEEVERLEALRVEVEEIVEPVRGGHFIVFHDSFQYFEHAFAVEAVASVTISPEVQPGARRIGELQAVIAQTGAVCLAAEPQFPREMVDLLATDQTRSTVLDPYGVDIAAGPELYGELLLMNARALAECLTPAA